MKVKVKKFQWLHGCQLMFSLLGAFLSLYLLIHHTRVKLGIQETSSFCSFGQFADCDIVNVSRFSEIAGVPLAALGILYFLALFLLGVLVPPKNTQFPTVSRLTAWMSSLALVFDLYLLVAIQWLELQSFCVLCILTYVANLGYLISGFRRVQLQTSSHRLQAFFWGSQPWSLRSFSIPKLLVFLLGMGLSGLLVYFIPHWIQQNSQTNQANHSDLPQVLEYLKSVEPKAVPVDSADGTYGNPTSKIKIVVFSDFQCPFCKTAAFSFHTLLPSFKDRVFLTFKHFPLDPACNPAVSHKMHPFACSLARLGVCAQKKGKFWEYHDRVFMKLEESDFAGGWDVLRTKLSSLFSSSEIDECLRNSASLEQVQKDIELGLNLGIQGTPATFINGKLVPIPVDLPILQKIIESELN